MILCLVLHLILIGMNFSLNCLISYYIAGIYSIKFIGMQLQHAYRMIAKRLPSDSSHQTDAQTKLHAIC